MKKLIALLTLAAIVTFPSLGVGQPIEDDPAYLPIDKVIDLKETPPKVNVNIPRFLLKDTLAGLAGTNQSEDVAALADLAKDVKLIRLIVIEANETNKAAIKKAMKTLKSHLDSKWTPIVKVADDDDEVGVYAMGDKSGELVAGIAVLVRDDNDAVIANVVGNVSVGKLIRMATQSKVLPAELLKMLQNQGQSGGSTNDEKAADGQASTTNAPAATATSGAGAQGTTNSSHF